MEGGGWDSPSHRNGAAYRLTAPGKNPTASASVSDTVPPRARKARLGLAVAVASLHRRPVASRAERAEASGQDCWTTAPGHLRDDAGAHLAALFDAAGTPERPASYREAAARPRARRDSIQ